jgi:UDP-3-O-[3-hydroxymyristoyl] glucosamine N-acyltransferase
MPIYQISELISQLGAKVKVFGKTGAAFSVARPIDYAEPDSICWLKSSHKNAESLLKTSPAAVIICDDLFPNALLLTIHDRCIVQTADPRELFIRIIALVFRPPLSFGIHPTAIIHPEAQIHEMVHIGPHVYIGKAKIGKNCFILGNNFIYDNVSLGDNVTVHAGAIIGADGFGYHRNSDLVLEKFEHIGGVMVEGDVEIGANTCIDRGSLGQTLIGKGTKIDNLVHVAHNVSIGRHCCIVAGAVIGGSTTIGDFTWIGHNSSILQKIMIGSHVTIGMGSVVTKDVPDHETWAGNPARQMEDLKKILRKFKEL